MTFPRQPPAEYREVEGVIERKCHGQWIPHTVEYFHRHKGNKFGLQTRCKQCTRTACNDVQKARYHPYRRAA